KFFDHSYGFRPLRSTHHAIARIQHHINTTGLNYVVDIDIKGFFDNINHTLLLKQLWNIGICDRQVLKIISKMLKEDVQKAPNKIKFTFVKSGFTSGFYSSGRISGILLG